MLARKKFCVALLMIGIVSGAQAGEYPDKLIRFIASAPAGTAPDIVARLIAPKMSEGLGQNVIVENKSGANGNLAAAYVANSPADGYTLLVTVAGTVTANPWLYPKTSVTDLEPISQIATADFIVASRSSLKLKTFDDLVALIRKEPGKVNAATTAHGSFPHFAAEMLKLDANLNFLVVKHNGGAAAGTSVAGEHTDFVIETRAVLNPLVHAGKLQPLASTGSLRSPISPDLPTVAEAGIKGYSMIGWFGMLAPKGTPGPVLDRVYKALAAALADEEVRKKLAAMDFVPVGNSPAEFAKGIATERAKLGDIVKNAKLQLE